VLFDLVGERDEVDLDAAAGWAGDDRRAAGTDVERLEDVPADGQLFFGVGGERNSDRVADALGEEDADADGGADGTGAGESGFGDAEVEWVGNFVRELAVGGDHGRDVECLQGDLDVFETEVFEDADLPEGSVHHSLRLRRWQLAVLKRGDRRQRAFVDADAD
jgi:hypothetical protein